MKTCSECRAYLKKMQLLFSQTGVRVFERIEPDPFLPTRVEALARQRRERPGVRKLKFQAKWVLASFLVVLSLYVGMEMGKQLARVQQSESYEFIATYTVLLNQSSPAVDFVYAYNDNEAREEGK